MSWTGVTSCVKEREVRGRVRGKEKERERERVRGDKYNSLIIPALYTHRMYGHICICMVDDEDKGW